MKKILLSFALIVGLLTSASTMQAQVNMSRYITLTVKNGAAIKLNFKAAEAGTPVRIESGSYVRSITVGTNWYNGSNPSTFKVTAQGTEMKVYGDITGFRCNDNQANLTALDVSNNTQLTELMCSSNTLNSLNVSGCTKLETLYCGNNQLTTLDVSNCTQLSYLNCFSNTLNSLNVSRCTKLTELNCSVNQLTSLGVSGCTQLRWLECCNNNFSTAALDDIYCSLPNRTGKTNGVIRPIFNSLSSNYATVLASNKANATTKNWKVQYYQNSADIPATTGTYVCQVNMNRYITLTVKKDSAIRFNFAAAAANTPVRIVSGSNTQNITVVGTGWTSFNYYTAGDITMTIYGDIIGFDCRGNGANLTALDISHNTQLTRLYCFGNNFTTAALNDIYCALPARQVSDNAQIFPLCDTSSVAEQAIVKATNAANATAKNWEVRKYNGSDNPIIATTGTYRCPPTTYNLWIAGVQVTSTNCSDLSVIPDVSGTVQYDPANKVLTLQNATIKINTTNAIVSYIDGLTIKVIGTNNLTTGNRATLYFKEPLTITGGGVLNAKSNTDCAIFANKTNLTIDGCTVNAKGYCGIAGNNGSSETLTIKNSTVTAEGVTDGSIVDFASLTLDGCAITQPAGAAFNTSLHAVALGGSVVTSKVVISPPQLNMDSYITLTVTDGKAIQFDLKAAAAGTPVRIVSGSNTQDITVGTGWKICPSYTADGTTMTVYGDIIGFNCYNNGENITGLDLSHNTQLTELYCSSNRLTSLDVSGCTRLMRLGCTDNRLTGLDLSHNTQLTELFCSSNRLTSLDVSGCTRLMRLGCADNRLTGLDLSHNTQLTELFCYKNKFSTQALDRIYCTLPDRDASDDAKVFPLHETSSTAEADAVVTTTVENATDKNWKVQTYKANHQHEDIATTGTYDCSTAVAEATAEPAITLYPNPVADVLYLSATARTIRVYNIYGIEVAHATDTDRIYVANLPAGVYTVKADGTVAKMVKR